MIGAQQVARWSAKGISDNTPEEFVAKIDAEVEKIRRRNALAIPSAGSGTLIDLFGYGKVREVLSPPSRAAAEDGVHGFFWGHDAAEALGWDTAEFIKWCQRERAWELDDQRREDEESGVVGWGCLNIFPLGVEVWQGEGDSRDHHVNGMMSGPIMRYWGDLWLVSTSKILPMMSSSPWSREWMDSVIPMMAFGLQASGLEEQIGGLGSYSARTNSLGETTFEPTGRTLADHFAADREGYTEEEAIRRAFRGPVADLGSDADGVV